MVRVKICGLCDAAAAAAAVEAGADLLGFHFCESRRRVTPEQARSIIDGLAVRPSIVGVFLDQEASEVRQVAEFVGVDWVQLHGSEAPGFDPGKPVIKVLKVRGGAPPDAGAWPDPVMLDTWSATGQGGTGEAWDWAVARPLVQTRKVFIAGGLEPGNVGRVVSGLRPYGVDVSSGVESAPRIKDLDKVRAFVHAVRLADVLA